MDLHSGILRRMLDYPAQCFFLFVCLFVFDVLFCFVLAVFPFKKAKGKGEKERYSHLNAEFQRIARRNKKAFLSDECKEIEGKQ